jgi:hypothetical protein
LTKPWILYGLILAASFVREAANSRELLVYGIGGQTA